MSQIFDLESQFTSYAAYHNNLVNQLIHIACVWPILWSALVMLHYTPVLLPTPPSLPSWVVVNMSLGGMILWSLFYLGLEVKNRRTLGGVGILAALLTVMSYVTAGAVKAKDTLDLPGIKQPVDVFQGAMVLHVVCWVAQFIGHGVFEGRAPALVNNLFQAIFMAPIFVLLEVLFMLGYKKEFRAKVQKLVDENIAAWKAGKEGQAGAKTTSSRPGAPQRKKSQKIN